MSRYRLNLTCETCDRRHQGTLTGGDTDDLLDLLVDAWERRHPKPDHAPSIVATSLIPITPGRGLPAGLMTWVRGPSPPSAVTAASIRSPASDRPR